MKPRPLPSRPAPAPTSPSELTARQSAVLDALVSIATCSDHAEAATGATKTLGAVLELEFGYTRETTAPFGGIFGASRLTSRNRGETNLDMGRRA